MPQSCRLALRGSHGWSSGLWQISAPLLVQLMAHLMEVIKRANSALTAAPALMPALTASWPWWLCYPCARAEPCLFWPHQHLCSKQRHFCCPETRSGWTDHLQMSFQILVVLSNLVWIKSSWGWQEKSEDLIVYKGASFGPTFRDKQK